MLFIFSWSINTFAQNILPIKKNNLWGFINDSGKVIIEPQFDFVGSFGDDGLAMAKKKGVFTMVDKFGWQLSPDNAQEVLMLGNGNFLVKVDNHWGLMNKQKEFLIAPQYVEIKVLNKQLIAAKNDDHKWGCLRYNNDTICDFVCDIIYRKNNGWIQAKRGKQISSYNENGERLFSDENDIQILDDNYFVFKEDGLWGVKNKMGDVVERAVYTDVMADIYGFVRLNKRNRSALFSMYHGKIVADSLGTIYLAKSNVFLFSNKQLKGLIQSNGKIIVPAEYVAFHYTGGSIMAVTPNNKWRLYTTDGKRALSGDFDQCDIYKYCNVAVIRVGDKWGVGNLFEKTLYPLSAHHIKMDGMNIKIYEGSKLLTITVDSNGTEIERREYNDVSQIKIRKKKSDINWESFAVSTQALNRNNMLGAERVSGDTVYRGHWFYVRTLQKWGLRNNKGKLVIPPTFSNVVINEEKGHTIVYSAEWSPNNYAIAGYALNPTYTMGVYDHVNYKYLLELDYISLRYDDFMKVDFARCIPNYENAKISLVNLKGEKRDNDFKYIGEFKEGRARCLVGGRVLNSPTKNDSTFIDYQRYFDDLKGVNSANSGASFLMNVDGKWGFVGASGAFVISPIYTKVEDFNLNVAVASVGTKWGMINDKNETVIPFQYDKIVRAEGMGDSLFFAVLANDKWGILEENGKVKTTALFDEISLTEEGYFQFKKGRYYGVLDSNYQLLFEDTCTKLISVGASEFVFKIDTVWTKINVLNNERKRISKAELAQMSKGAAEEKQKPNKGSYSFIGPLINGRAIVKKDEKFNYINEKGKLIANDWYDEAENFHDNFAVVKVNKLYYKIDYDGDRLSQAYHDLRYLNHGLYKMSDSLNSYIINNNNDTLVWLNSKLNIQLDNEVGIFNIAGKKGLINAYSDFVISPKYSDLHYLGNGKYKYKVNAFTTVFDVHGNRIVNIPAENIEAISADLFKIETGNRIGYLKRNGEWLWPLSY